MSDRARALGCGRLLSGVPVFLCPLLAAALRSELSRGGRRARNGLAFRANELGEGDTADLRKEFEYR